MTPVTNTTRNGSLPDVEGIQMTADRYVPGPPAATTGGRLREQPAREA